MLNALKHYIHLLFLKKWIYIKIIFRCTLKLLEFITMSREDETAGVELYTSLYWRSAFYFSSLSSSSCINSTVYLCLNFAKEQWRSVSTSNPVSKTYLYFYQKFFMKSYPLSKTSLRWQCKSANSHWNPELERVVSWLLLSRTLRNHNDDKFNWQYSKSRPNLQKPASKSFRSDCQTTWSTHCQTPVVNDDDWEN